MHSRLRSLAFGALLFVLPFSGIRVICIESPAKEGSSAVSDAPAESAEEARPLTDCERLCPFHPPTDLQSADPASSGVSGTDADCALSSEAAALQMLGTIAVLRPYGPPVIPDVVTDAPVLAPSTYSDPALALLAPPPKSSVL